MIRDATRYVPLLARARHIDSLWEIKTLLPRSDDDDSRPILFQDYKAAPGFYSVLGGKIDNIIDVRVELGEILR